MENVYNKRYEIPLKEIPLRIEFYFLRAKMITGDW